MLLLLLQIFAGFCTTSFGFWICYFYVTGVDQGRSALLILPAILCIAAGIFLLLKAGKKDNKMIFRNPLTPDKIDDVKGPSLDSKIQENNQIIGEYEKTNKAKEKLKMLELSSTRE